MISVYRSRPLNSERQSSKITEIANQRNLFRNDESLYARFGHPRIGFPSDHRAAHVKTSVMVDPNSHRLTAHRSRVGHPRHLTRR